MPKNVFSAQFSPDQEQQLREILEHEGFSIKPVEHAFWQAQKERIFITFYRSGKVVIRGKNIEGMADRYLSSLKFENEIHGLESIDNLTHWAGTDESGKGDLFGPLVIGAVFVDRDTEHLLWQKGFKDSKKLKPERIRELANFLKRSKRFPYTVKTIRPAEYNRLYQRYRNLNELLAYGHAEAIKHLAKKVNCQVVLSDQFGNVRLLKEALGDDVQIKLVQKVRAEQNLAVAAAAILARDAFVNYLEKMSEKYMMTFPLGASLETQNALKKFVQNHGKEELINVAKLHFKPVKKILLEE